MTEETKPSGKTAGNDKNVGMAILCYFGVLVLIPLLTEAKNDPFVKFHIKQGLVLWIFTVIISAVWIIPVIGRIAASVGILIAIVLFIIGIINSASGKEEKLPLIGQYGDKFKI